MAEVIDPTGLPREAPDVLPAPGAPPATWYEGPYVAAEALRRSAGRIADPAGQVIDSDELARDLRGAASVLDGASR